MTSIRDYLPNSKYAQITLICSVILAIIIISLESVVAAQFLPTYSELKGTTLEGIPVYLMIFLSSQIFQVVLCWDAVYHQNTIQIIGFVGFNACCFFYSLFQYFQITRPITSTNNVSKLSVGVDDVKSILIAISVILGLSVCLFAWLAFKLYLEFGWKIYKKIGADPRMKNMYRTYQIFLMILKLDVFFFLAFSIQFVVLILDPKDPEFTLTIVAIPITIIVIVTAVYGLRQENTKIMILFIVGCLFAMAYFIFKLVRMYSPSQAFKYENTVRFLTFFAALSLFAVTITTINAVVCLMNFGKGLKQHIATSNSTSPGVEKSPERKMTLADQ